MFAAFLTTILFSISAVCATRTAKIMGGTEANFWRLLVGAGVLAIWAYGFGAGLGGDAFPYFFVSGLIGFGIGDLALFQTLPRLGSRLTILLVQCLAAPIAAVTEWFWLGTQLSVAQIACGLTILAGISLALAPGKHLKLTSRERFIGTIFGIVAAAGQGLGAVLSRKAFEVAAHAGQNIDGITAAYQRILGGLILGGIFLLIVKREHLWPASNRKNDDHTQLATREKWRRSWLWILFNALAGPALGVSCYQWALKTTASGVVLPIVATTPLVVIPFARAIEGERPNARSIIGGAIAVAGAVTLAFVTTH